MARVTVLYFAVARERLGLSEEVVDVAAGATVATLWETLCARHAGLSALEPVLKFAVNQRFVARDAALAAGDEVALIPPVAGGQGAYVRISDAAIALDEVTSRVGHDSQGGLVTFSGIVRRNSRGKIVERLEYEAYRPMAERELASIAQRIVVEWPGARIAIVHRVGVLAVGEIAVVIAVSAPHRKEAFLACEAAIDRLKQSVPIWKKDSRPTGNRGSGWDLSQPLAISRNFVARLPIPCTMTPSAVPSLLSPRHTERMPDRGRPSRLLLCQPHKERMPIDGSVSIGSALDNQVRIADARVSRRHCVIECSQSGVRIRDLESTNGTFVNGLRVTSAELFAGATIELGDARLAVVSEHQESMLTERLAGKSAQMESLRAEILRLAPARLGVLIRGETGTGKELVARALHDLGGRRGQFVALNCGAIARELIESELFGHERGAFTGAGSRRTGLFEEARKGTLFLDEIGELPLELQPRLLRVLETGVVRPVGSNREIAVDVRIIAATHVDLARAVRDGAFREDLFFRLSGAELTTPPLRARVEDIAPLAERFLAEECAGDGARRYSQGAIKAMCGYEWPGNVRELRNVIRRAVALGGKILHERDLGLRQALSLARDAELVRVDGRALGDIEREIFSRALERANGSRRGAAKMLGIPKSTLCDKVKRYRIDAVSPTPQQARLGDLRPALAAQEAADASLPRALPAPPSQVKGR